MSTGNTSRGDGDLDAFLARESPLSTVYDAIEPVQPPEVLDARILAMARGAASAKATGAGAGGAAPAKAPPAPRPGAPGVAPGPARPAAGSTPAVPKAPATGKPSPAAPAPGIRPSAVDTDDDDDADDAPPPRRPRWLVPAALAATVLVAVGIGVNVLDRGTEPAGADRATSSRLGAIFAKRARERQEAEKAAAEAAAAAASQEAEVELAPLPPPPFFGAGGPVIEDVDKAIAVIRRELVLANQLAATAEEAAEKAPAGEQALSTSALSAPAATAPATADAAPAGAVPAAPASTADAAIVQPRNRRLAKILELYDSGNPELAVDSLEIFLRDFADDPISQRIEDSQPRATDVAVE